MRRILSPEEVESKKKRNNLIIGVILIILLVGSTAGFALYGREGTITDQTNNEDFMFDGQYYIYNSGGQSFYFTNNQDETREIPVEITLGLNDYAGQVLYIDSSDTVATEIANNIDRFVVRIQKVCYGTCEEDLPEKTCEEKLIVFRQSEENRVYQEQNCIFIEGNEDMISVDAFLYRILNI